MPVIGGGSGSTPATVADRIVAVDGPDIFRGSVDPNGVVAANRVGDIYLRRVTGTSPKLRIYHCYQTDGTAENSGWTDMAKDTAPLVFSWQVNGTLTTGNIPFPHYIREYDFVAVRFALSVSTAPTGAAIEVDFKRNGESGSMFSPASARPRILAGATFGETTVITDPSLGEGAYVQPEITQVGSSVAGANLGMHMWALVS